VRFGAFPTPVFRADAFCSEQTELYVKNDGLSALPYGGNKVRKLEMVLGDALERGARRVLTAGAAGSHQGLAAAIYGARVGLEVAAVLCPQPYSEHAESTLRAALGAGLEVIPARSRLLVPALLARARRRGDFFVAVGASSVRGAAGYATAMQELRDQIDRGQIPEPDVIVVALGSGGTLAGIAAGALEQGLLGTRLIGVDVAGLRAAGLPLVLGLAASVLASGGGLPRLPDLVRRVHVQRSQLGAGYGHVTPSGLTAIDRAAEIGLSLDPTYTAKAFAEALRLVDPGTADLTARGQGAAASGLDPKERLRRPLRVLYWHTLSATPLSPLLEAAPRSLPAELARLLVTNDRR
jgi:D-cysteine desulfhydrase